MGSDFVYPSRLASGLDESKENRGGSNPAFLNMPVLTESEYKLRKPKEIKEENRNDEKPAPVPETKKPKPKITRRMKHPDSIQGAEISTTIELFGRKIEIERGIAEVTEEEADELEKIGWQKGRQL